VNGRSLVGAFALLILSGAALAAEPEAGA